MILLETRLDFERALVAHREYSTEGLFPIGGADLTLWSLPSYKKGIATSQWGMVWDSFGVYTAHYLENSAAKYPPGTGS